MWVLKLSSVEQLLNIHISFNIIEKKKNREETLTGVRTMDYRSKPRVLFKFEVLKTLRSRRKTIKFFFGSCVFPLLDLNDYIGISHKGAICASVV